MNLLVQKMEALNVSKTELSNLLGLNKKESKLMKNWLKDSSLIPKNILNKLKEIPNEAPFKTNNDKFSFIDLFAGIGGLRLGFQQNGGNCVFSSEWDKYAQLTYRTNFGETPHGDITKINEKDIPDHDILIGGFPCQAFSRAGKKNGFEDTRGTLFFDIARIINKKRPKAFLLENVRDLVIHDKKRTFETILKVLKNLNYEVFYKVLVSTDFGVPQNRHRIIIVGFNKDCFSKNFNFETNFNFPLPLDKEVKVGDILEDSSKLDSKYTLSDKAWKYHQDRKIYQKSKGNGFGFSLFNDKSPYTNTISARYYKDGSEALIDQPKVSKNPRRLTPRECARLQGFPENFLLPCSDTQSYKQFGNSVTVPLMNAVAKEILKTLKKAQ